MGPVDSFQNENCKSSLYNTCGMQLLFDCSVQLVPPYIRSVIHDSLRSDLILNGGGVKAREANLSLV